MTTVGMDDAVAAYRAERASNRDATGCRTPVNHTGVTLDHPDPERPTQADTDNPEGNQKMSLNVYRDQCGQAAEANGWHNKYQFAEAHVRAYGPRYEQALLDHIVAKTALIGCEVAEAIEEIRDGHEPCETYYGEGGKPEGYPSELADVIVRALDLAYMLGIDIEDAVQEKLAFNASRGQMHGGKKL